MKSIARYIFLGICVAVMAHAAGIVSFSADWWAWILAGNALHAFGFNSRKAANT